MALQKTRNINVDDKTCKRNLGKMLIVPLTVQHVAAAPDPHADEQLLLTRHLQRQ